MSVTVCDLPPTAENMKRATMLDQVRLDGDSRRRKQRRYVKLHQEAISGRYYIIDRRRGRRYAKAVRVLAIDGKLLNSGSLVLEEGK